MLAPSVTRVTPRTAADDRIRVLRVIARMNVGGPALQVTALTEDLDPDRFEQRLLVGSVDPGEADYRELRAPDLPARVVTGLGRAPRPGDDLRALRAIVGEIRRFRPHVIHTHTAKAGALGRMAAVVTRVPARVHTFHGHLLRGYFSPRATRLVTLTERGLARVTDRLVAVGRQVRDDLLAAGVGRPEQYVVVAPGVDVGSPPSREEARRALGLDPSSPVVAFVARLTQVKRPDRMVETAGRLVERFPDLTVLVVGEGELLEETRRQAAPLGGHVRFLGWRPDVETVYAAADVTLLTSDNEGMPVSLIEASAVGSPAVTTDVGSASEVVRDGATGFVTPVDPGALADATARILGDEDLRRRLSEGARRHAAEAFGRSRLVADMAAVYVELAREKGVA